MPERPAPASPPRTGTPVEISDRFEFDRVVNAIDDLGWDPTGRQPVDATLANHLVDDTLIEVPPGRYLVTTEHRARGLSNWGIRGLGEHKRDVQFVVPRNRAQRIFNIVDRSRNVLVENLTFDQYDTWDTSIGNVFHVADGLLVRDVEYAGKNPNEFTVGTSKLNVYVVDPDGVAVLDGVVKTGPTDLTEYPWNPLMVFSGSETTGTLYIRNSHFANCGEHAVYASRCEGNVRIENCRFENNQNTHARLSGEGSWVTDSTFVWDIADHRNRGQFQATTGLTFESGYQGFSGGLVSGCDFVCRTSGPNSGCLKIDGSHGGVTVRDCRFIVDADGAEPIWADAPGDSHMIRGLPAKPWDVELEGVAITGSGRSERGHTGAVELRDRSESELQDVCIEMTGNRDGIVLANSRRNTIADATIDVPGEPIVLADASAETTNVAVGGSCPGQDGTRPPTGRSPAAFSRSEFLMGPPDR